MHGEVIVNTGDSLHLSPIAHTQAVAIYPLHLAYIGGAKLCNRNTRVPVDDTGHASVPQ